MKNKIQGFILGTIFTSIITLGISVFATGGLNKTIEVTENPIHIQVNGEDANSFNFVYNGKTYVQLRDICNMLNANYTFNGDTSTFAISSTQPTANTNVNNDSSSSNTDSTTDSTTDTTPKSSTDTPTSTPSVQFEQKDNPNLPPSGHIIINNGEDSTTNNTNTTPTQNTTTNGGNTLDTPNTSTNTDSTNDTVTPTTPSTPTVDTPSTDTNTNTTDNSSSGDTTIPTPQSEDDSKPRRPN